MSKEQDVIFRITDSLVADGLSEVVNYSFMDKKDLEKLNFPWGHKVYNAIPIMNPISEEYPDMRTTLLPGLMHTLSYNISQKNEEAAIFESGHVYQPKELPLKELPYEYELFSGLLYFNQHPVDQIIGEGTDTKGLGLAIMNRLTKASGYHIVVEKKERN